MTSKKKLKNKYNKLKIKVAELDDSNLSLLWAVVNMINIYDNNMELIQKTFELVVKKINRLNDKINPFEHIDINEELDEKEDGTG